MAFFLTLVCLPVTNVRRCVCIESDLSIHQAYLAISIDASGLIRFLAFWVLKQGGGVGHRLYLLLYLFFFILGSFIGNASTPRPHRRRSWI